MWCPEGAGFDDKTGIFLIIKIITSGLKPCIILSCNEEIGGLGASELAKLECPFSELKYCIELDRMGSNDCVFYSCANDEFEQYVESFGFKTNIGSFSDISRLCPAWGVAGVNLSVGYIDEHTTNERLYVKSMLRTLSRVKKMLTMESIPFFAYVQDTSYYSLDTFDKYYNLYDFPTDDDEDDDWLSSYYLQDYTAKCDCCGKERDINSLFPIIRRDKSTGYRCYNCLDETIGWCDYCKEPFELEPGQLEYICPKCQEELLVEINVD